MKIQIHNETTGRNERVSIPQPFWKGSQRLRSGVNITALYYGPNSHRCFIRTHSFWADASGHCEGTKTQEVSLYDLLRHAETCSAGVPLASLRTKRMASKKIAA